MADVYEAYIVELSISNRPNIKST